MIIGSSKSQSLYDKFQSEDSVYRNLKYEKGEKPLVVKDIPEKDTSNSELYTRIIDPLVARADDVVRITKLLGKPGGIRWEAHQAELQTIQSTLDKKNKVRNPEGNSGTGILSTIKNIGASLIKSVVQDVGVTAGTLAQVALTGTGYHGEPYLTRSYIVKPTGGSESILDFLLTSTGVVRGDHVSAANLSKEGKQVHSTEGSLSHTMLNAVVKGSLSVATQSYRAYKENGDFTTVYTSHSIVAEEKAGAVSDLLAKARAKTKIQGYTMDEISKNPIASKVASEADSRPEGLIDDPDLHTIWKVLEGPEKNENEQVTVSSDPLTGKSYKQGYFRGYKVFPSGSAEEDNGGSIQNWEGDDSHGEGYKDFLSLIPFEIVMISPEKRRHLCFEANLTSYKDNYSGNWTGTQYVGRAEQFFTYEGFTREISFGFVVVAHRADQLIPLYKELNFLAGLTAPSYDTSGLFMRGTLSALTIGDLLYKQTGFFKSVGISWDKDTMWEVNDEYLRVPHMLSVDLTFVPIHSFNVQWNTPGYFGNVTSKRSYLSTSSVDTGKISLKATTASTTPKNPLVPNVEVWGS